MPVNGRLLNWGTGTQFPVCRAVGLWSWGGHLGTAWRAYASVFGCLGSRSESWYWLRGWIEFDL